MNLEQYFRHSTHKKLTLVGPLLEHKRTFPNTTLVFVDGGTRFRHDKEGFSVGDGDSYPKSLDETLPQQKDFSDLAYVLNHADAFAEIEAWGFWGGRKDHELANLGEFHRFLKRQKKAEVQLPPHARGFSAGEWNVNITELYSLLTLESNDIEMTGNTQYPVMPAQTFLPLSSFGISNQGSGEVIIRASRPFFLFYQL